MSLNIYFLHEALLSETVKWVDFFFFFNYLSLAFIPEPLFPETHVSLLPTFLFIMLGYARAIFSTGRMDLHVQNSFNFALVTDGLLLQKQFLQKQFLEHNAPLSSAWLMSLILFLLL